MPNSKSSYVSFLLRLHRVQTQEQRVWGASVQSTATGEMRAFSDVGALVEFLLSEFGEGAALSIPADCAPSEHPTDVRQVQTDQR